MGIKKQEGSCHTLLLSDLKKNLTTWVYFQSIKYSFIDG